MAGKKQSPWLPALEALAAGGNTAPFYSWRAWRRLREQVRRMDNGECQLCKARGKYRRGSIVHHVRHVEDRPDLALSIWDPDTGERQLVTVCKTCHEALHPEGLRQNQPAREPLTPERWD